ncbi:MAG: fimbrial major subunit CsuA/B family protein [Acidobacteria bacterium]|nr:fimbrial major subunit CsuA/B family protein [Acidobacteriota bacterium]
MPRNLRAPLLIAIVCWSFSAEVHAQSTVAASTSMTVTASIAPGGCGTVILIPPDGNIGTIIAGSTTNQPWGSSVTVRCSRTPASPVAFKVGFGLGANSLSGQRRMKKSADFVTYNITDGAGTAIGDNGCGGSTGTPLTGTITGVDAILAVELLANVPANQATGNYADTVTITVCM